MPTRTIAYLRVSTEKQAGRGVSLDAQRAKVKAYAKLYDLELAEVIVDAGESAKHVHRPGLQRALGMLKRGEADALLVVKLDRLTRSVRDLGHLVEKYFARGKAALLSVGEQIDTRSAAGRLVLNVLGSVSQWEREAIGERTATAMQRRELRLAPSPSVTAYVGFKAPDALASNQIWTLPAADGTNGQVLTTNGAGVLSWSTAAIVSSDRNAKENFRPEDGERVLQAIARMPVTSRNYKSESPSIRHFGPMAQDFYGAFHLGESDKTISTVDISGVNLLAAQALEKRSVAQASAIDSLRAENVELRARLDRMERACARWATR